MNNQLSNIPIEYQHLTELSTISTQYRKFSKGQYIDHQQFNEFLDFFEDQDRLSRTLLQGVGVVCGLKAKPLYKDSLLKSIQLSQGVALTTDGDLLTLNNINKISEELYVSDLKTLDIESKEYTYFKVYDNFKVKYPAFYEGKNQIELWELATDLEKNSDFQTIGNLSNLEDKYLLLYLESYEKEVKPCRGVDCDNHGVQQIRNLKVLLTTADGIKYIIEKDRIQEHPLFFENILQETKQERAIVERLILENGIDKDFYPSDLKRFYAEIIERNGFAEHIFKKVNIISDVFGISPVDHQIFKTKLEKYLTQESGFQYAYDVVKDLEDTYSEIIKFLPQSFTKYLPYLASFPKHIMLGKLISDKHLDPTRHRFYNSPALDDHQSLQKVIMLIERFKQQVENFREWVDLQSIEEIKITPSNKLLPLGNKTIPFYYKVTEAFLKAWSFDKTNIRSANTNLAYDSDLLSTDEHIQKPMYFNKDNKSFYNIEGHQGLNYDDVYEQIKQIRDEQQLDFDIMGLSFGEVADKNDLFKAYFNEYVDKHPGLEHKRGVEKGGTFVMVYEINGRYAKIVADFSIPYICCTPKIDVKLTLPSSVICSKSEPVPFTVFPMNGDVKAIVGSGLKAGVTLNSDGKYIFDPTLVSKELYNKEIAFTVNGKSTNCKIKVIPQSDIDVVVDAVIHSNETETTVKFIISGDNFEDYDYIWDFWNNGGLVTLNPDEKRNVTYVYKNLNPFIIPVIKVNVVGGGCTQTIVIDNWYEETPIIIKGIVFEKGGDCCEGRVPK